MRRITETQWIWRDGQFIPWADATVHVLAHSVQFGSSAFEGIRAYNTPKGPAIFRLREHLERLYHSCRIYRMDIPFSMDQLVEASRELVVRNGLESCYIRPMVVRGYGTAGMVPIGAPIEVYIPCWPWGAYLGDEALEAGVDACISTWHRVEPNTIPAMAKIAGNDLSGQLIKMEALANGYAEGIALSPSGMVSEGSGQNVFIVSKGTINFDRCIATPDMRGLVGRLGKVLGPRGLRPNPRVGTVTMDVATAVKGAKGGSVEFRVEKAGIVHAGVGKASFTEPALVENIRAFVGAINRAKPSGAKGTYIRKVSLSSTMGPGLKLDVATLVGG